MSSGTSEDLEDFAEQLWMMDEVRILSLVKKTPLQQLVIQEVGVSVSIKTSLEFKKRRLYHKIQNTDKHQNNRSCQKYVKMPMSIQFSKHEDFTEDLVL